MQVEIATERLQFVQEPDQMLKAAAEPVDRPDRDHVDLARRRVPHQPIKAGTLVAALRATDAGVLVELDHLPARPRGDRFQLTALVLGGLPRCADSKINADALHDAAPRYIP